MSRDVTRIEIVAAVRNEAQSLPSFVDRVRGLSIPDDVELRLVFVEDSSTDDTLDVLRALAAAHSDIGYWALERGYGQGPAIVFALSRSDADACILMDVDGSHPPEVIPAMIERHLEGAGVVQCVRRRLSDRRVHRRAASWLFQTLASRLVGIDLTEQAIYYRLVSRRFARRIVSDPRTWRFLRFPLPRGPGELVKLEVDSRERTQGESNYGPLRLARLAIDAILSLMSPLRFGIGAALALVAALVLARSGAWLFALALGGALIWALRRYRGLRSADLLARLSVRESANVPAAAPAA